MTVSVLLIDEEDDARATLADRLRRLRGLELVGAVRDKQEFALTLAKTDPDVVLVDLHGRHWEGDRVQLCNELHKMASVPLVVLVSFMTRERWQQLREAGVTNCLLKQVDSERLERELVRVGTNHRSGSSAPMAGREKAQ